jgi:hypothetical protein
VQISKVGGRIKAPFVIDQKALAPFTTKKMSRQKEADTIFNYLLKSEFFMNEGNIDLLLAKTPANGFHFRFPVKASFSNAEGLQKVDDFVKQLKQDVFINNVLCY